MKKYVKEYFEKAVAKRQQHDKRKAERRAKEGHSVVTPSPAVDSKALGDEILEKSNEISEDEHMSDLEDDEPCKEEQGSSPLAPGSHGSPSELKRKREEETVDGESFGDEDSTSSKKLKFETPPPPPPPPPPPAEGRPFDMESHTLDDAEPVDAQRAESETHSGGEAGFDPSACSQSASPSDDTSLHMKNELPVEANIKLDSISNVPSTMQLATPSSNGNCGREDGLDELDHQADRNRLRELPELVTNGL